MPKAPIPRLSRYTTLPVLLDMLQRKKLTLLDPKYWEDRNDSEIILEYKRRKNIQNLFAMCLSCGDETVHHWKTFSNGNSGCMIEIDAPKLFAILNKVPDLVHGKVIYKKLADVEGKHRPIPVDKMPFTKRWPYRVEEEYRIIVTPKTNESFFDIDIPLNIINRIVISQQMPEKIYESIKDYLKELRGNPDSRINRSTLYENKRWINRFR